MQKNRNFIAPLAAATLMCFGATHAYASAATDENTCTYDEAAMLALDQQAFDQDQQGGWRPLARKATCKTVAADLIKKWRETNKPGDTSEQVSILFWHEGQLRAQANDYEAAKTLFTKSYKDEQVDTGWNHYVAASIAFLDRDRDALEKAYMTLKSMPEPGWWKQAQEQFKKQFNVTQPWPPNLDVVEGFRNCFEKSYVEAYSKSCKP